MCIRRLFVSRNSQIALLEFSACKKSVKRIHYTSNVVLCPSPRRFRRLKRFKKVHDAFLHVCTDKHIFYFSLCRRLERRCHVIGLVFTAKNASKTLCAHTLKVIQFNHVQHSALQSKGLELALCKQNWPRPDKLLTKGKS